MSKDENNALRSFVKSINSEKNYSAAKGELQEVELSLQQLEHKRTDLSSRMKDDFGLELALLATTEPTCGNREP